MNHDYLNIWCRPKNDIKWPYNAWAKFTESGEYILDDDDPEIVEKFHQWLQKYLYGLWNPEDWDMRMDDPPLYICMSYDSYDSKSLAPNSVSTEMPPPGRFPVYYKAWKSYRTGQYDILDVYYDMHYGEST